MVRLLLLLSVGLLIAPNLTRAGDIEKLQGTWEITALVDDGTVVPQNIIRSRFAQDGRFTISGQSLRFLTPSTLQQRAVLFTIDEKASPKTLDLAGSEKTGGQGVYLLADDVLIICIGEPGTKVRPIEFAAPKGSPNLLMTLSRVKVVPGKAPPEKKAEPAVPRAMTDDELKKALIGTWGHQNDDYVMLVTLNTDGTFSSSREYKRRFGRLFNDNVRSSGTWKLQDGVVVATITASTDKDLRNQVFSYRFRSISATDLVAVDQFGNLHREWKAR